MKKINLKKLILPNIPYVFIALLITKVSEAARLAPGADLSGKLLNIMTGMSTAFQSIMPSFHPIDLCVGIVTFQRCAKSRQNPPFCEKSDIEAEIKSPCSKKVTRRSIIGIA